MSHTLQLTTIRFPEISLAVRDAHKLRGYFGNLFREHSPLLHNHLETGENSYQYPLVQYKVLGKTPTLVGINEGAELLIHLFLKIRELRIEEAEGRTKVFEVHQKNIENRQIKVGLNGELHSYHFSTLWMALNQQNHREYLREDEQQRKIHLQNVLKGNILSFYKGLKLFLSPEERVMVSLETTERQTKFKDNVMLAFQGKFVTNALLPTGIGLGKSVARGFGTVQSADHQGF